MNADLVGALHDGLFLLLLWLPGIFGASVMGARGFLQVLPLGFLLSTALLSLWFTLTTLTRVEEYFWVSSKIVFAIALVVLGALVARQKSSLATVLWWPLATSTVVILVRNVFLLDTRPGFADQFVVGYVGWLLQSGFDASVFGEVEYLKRSFAVPLLLAAGREGSLLIAVIPLMAILLLFATYHLINVVTPGVRRWIRLVVFLAVLSVWATTSLYWGMFGYQNAHILVALAVTVLASGVLTLGATRHSLPRVALGAVFVGSFTLAQARIEAVGLGLLISLPLLLVIGDEPGPGRRKLALALIGGPLGFALWLITVDTDLLEPVPPLAALALVVPIVLLGYLPRVSRALAQILMPAAFGILAGVVLWLFAVADGAPKRRNQFIENTFLGEGMWGYVAVAFLAILAITYLRTKTQQENWLIWMTVVGLLFTVAVKIVDGLFIIGGVPGFGRGWTDSVNRGFFHLFGPMTATMVAGILGVALERGRPAPRKEVNVPLVGVPRPKTRTRAIRRATLER